MDPSQIYELEWRSFSLTEFEDIVCNLPDISGVYMIVVNAKSTDWTPIYVGQTNSIKRRLFEHYRDWFMNPDSETYVPISADEFLEDPVDVFNKNRLKRGLSERKIIMRNIREQCKFYFATPDLTHREHGLKELEYLLQEAVKQKFGIEVSGHIGDGNSAPPSTDLVISNTFKELDLVATLPHTIFHRNDQIRLPKN